MIGVVLPRFRIRIRNTARNTVPLLIRKYLKSVFRIRIIWAVDQIQIHVSFSWSLGVPCLDFLINFSSTARFSNFCHNTLVCIWIQKNAWIRIDESRSEILHKKTSQIYEYHDMNAFELPKFHPVYLPVFIFINFCGIVTGFNGVVAINKTELNRLRQVSSCDLQQRCSGSVTFLYGSRSADLYPLDNGSGSSSFLHWLAKTNFF